MAPHVKKAKTAFLYYQAHQLSKIRQQLGPAASMGEAMTEVSTSIVDTWYCVDIVDTVDDTVMSSKASTLLFLILSS
jgi:hypothetical protein